MGWLPASADFEKSSGTLDTHAGDGGAEHHIVCLVICIRRQDMLLPLGLGWLPRLLMLLVGCIQHRGMGLPGPTSGGPQLCHSW